MKKILSVVAMLLMLCMLVTLAPITALAADTPTIVISDAKNTAGSEVEVTVALVNNPGVNRMMLFLQYDTSKLTYVGVEDSEDGFIGNTHNPATGLLKWNQGIDNLEGDVTLATVTFKIAEGLADGETATISVTYDNSDAQIINNNGETVDFAVIPGTVTVGEPDPNPIEDFVYLIDGENLIIGDYVGSTKTVIIAETYEIDGEVYTVTEINGFSKKSGKTTYTYVPFYANGTKGDTDDTFVEVVYIPATVTKIGSLDDEYYPFYGCMDLKHAYIYGDPEIADGTLGVYYDEAEEADIAVPTTTIHAYADTGVEAYAESWGIAFEAIVDAPAGCEHVAGEAVRENETDSTCTVAGTYDEVVYCSVCGEELSRTEKTKELAAHTEAAAVVENETNSTCTVAGTYDEVVYCSVCGEELSRTEKTKELAAHTEAAAVVENETDSTCTVAGTYDEVVYCSVCGEELSRTEKTKELAAHTEAAAVVENETDSTCTVAGTYDEVVYCSVCGEELSRTEKTKELAAHTEAAAVVENETNSTCTVAGTYEEVVYCSVCGEELSRTEKTKELADHTEADAVRENETDSTCTVAGTYDEVVYCSVCGEELSRTEKTKALADHTEADAVRENETDSTCTVAGTYDEVIYCSVCDKELSRTEKTKELADHSWTAADCETARTCSVCGETDGVALGHDFSVEIESVDPTVDAEGYTVYQCSRCDETKTVTVEKLTKPTLTLDGTTVTVNDPSNVLVQTGVKYVGANSGIDATAIVDWADFTGLTGTALNGKNGYTNNGKATAIQVAENGDYIFYVIYKNGDTSAFYAEKITVVAAAGVPTVTVTGNTATLDINGNTLVQLGAKYVGNATINAADIKTMSAFTKLTGTALDGKSGYSNLGKNTVANLADGGNYIFYVIYKDALGNTKTIFINVTVNVANDKPTIEVVDGVATLKDNGFTLVQSGVKYVGDADVNAADIKGWGTFTKLAGTALNGKSGYTNLGKATEANLTEAGNYVYYVIYKDANNVTRTIFYNVTVE